MEDCHWVLTLCSYLFQNLEAQVHILNLVMALPYYICDVHLFSPRFRSQLPSWVCTQLYFFERRMNLSKVTTSHPGDNLDWDSIAFLGSLFSF